MCYYVKFGRSASKGVCINKWEPQKLVSAAWASPPCSGGIVDPLESWPSPYITLLNVIILRQTVLPRSLKVIGTDIDRSTTCDFLLTFHSNHGPILYYFRDKQ